MFYDFFLRSFRIFLLPLALLYWLAIAIRNWFYDRQWLRTATFGMPLITVGNLAIGGTGKSPLIEYLVALLRPHFKVATLSRGYRRRTRGYALAQPGATALDIGDEPLALHRKFPDVPVAVGEERLLAIPELLHDCPDTQVILLDDAFQHRSIEAGMSILLTEYANLFTRDFYLPTGDLRDLKRRYKEASIVIVTKCPPDLSESQRSAIEKEIALLPHQHLFFTAYAYGTPYHLLTKEPQALSEDQEVLLVTGISNPRPLKQYIEQRTASYHLLAYRDHHIFTIQDLRDIVDAYQGMDARSRLILTTEKDAVRLEKFDTAIAPLPWYVIPIGHRFLFNDQQRFDRLVIDFIKDFKPPQG